MLHFSKINSYTLVPSTEELRNLIKKGEGQQLDFKHSITSIHRIARAIVSFANSKGGVLLIGVKDNGKPAKINVEEEFYMLEGAFDLCKPTIEFEIERMVYGEKNILYVHIKKGRELPYLCKEEDDKWLAYVRVSDSNVLANWVWLQVARQKQKVLNTHFEYQGKEEELLKALRTDQQMTQKELSKLPGMRWRQAGQILVKLVSLGIVDMNFSKDGVFYTVRAVNES